MDNVANWIFRAKNGLCVVLVFLFLALSFIGPFAGTSMAKNHKFDIMLLKHLSLWPKARETRLLRSCVTSHVRAGSTQGLLVEAYGTCIYSPKSITSSVTPSPSLSLAREQTFWGQAQAVKSFVTHINLGVRTEINLGLNLEPEVIGWFTPFFPLLNNGYPSRPHFPMNRSSFSSGNQSPSLCASPLKPELASS